MTPDQLRARDAVYRKRRKLRRYQRQGRPAFVDAAPVYVRLKEWRAEGWTEHRVAETAGIPVEGLRHRPMRMETARADAVLKVTRAQLYSAAKDYDLVPAHGAQRRLKALSAIGWPHNAVIIQDTASDVMRAPNGLMRARTWRTIRDQYNRLSMDAGPSAAAKARAARMGWAPPLAWDDDTIDDPSGMAVGTK